MSRFYFTSIVALFACILTSCTVENVALSARFDPTEVAFINKTGQVTINGQAFLRRNDGIVVYGAGSTVRLVPKGAYSTERINALYGGADIAYHHKTFSPESAEYARYIRQTTANGEGRFTFKGVAPGRYFVVAPVSWKAGDIPQGGSLKRDTTVKGGETLDIVMTTN